jgi:transposase
MRGSDVRAGDLFSYVDLEKRVPAKHPLRLVRVVVNEVLSRLDGDFAKAYAIGGRPSIAPERLLRALLLQAFYTIRSERQLMEQLDYNLLYRWFVGLGVDEAVWVPTVFTKNRDRLLEADVARKFLAELMDHNELRGAVVGRALLGRRHADCGLGLDEEFQGEGRFGRSARLGPQWRARFSRREAQQRHACLDHGSRGAALSQGTGQGSQAQLHGPHADGKPQRTDRRGHVDPGDRYR